jgi:hypothetical protein
VGRGPYTDSPGLETQSSCHPRGDPRPFVRVGGYSTRRGWLRNLSGVSHAVFRSYASQDAEAAQTICGALRAAGIEVFFVQSELRGGDVWDQKIRHEIHEQIASALDRLLNHRNLSLQDADVVTSALEHLQEAPGTRKVGHLPLGTFDKDLARLEGTQRLR